jgi:uncharacterized protein YndB with AHSA1/START domain
MAQKLHFEININAPREKVWETMLSDETYREWTSVFMPGGYYEGEWQAGSKMLFVAPDEKGQLGGMVSNIAEVRKPEFVSIKHIGIMDNGEEKIGGEITEDWGDALENYTFQEENGATKLLVDMDSADDYIDDFNESWPKALAKLKELSESK